MTRKLPALLILSLLVIAFLAVSAFGMYMTEKEKTELFNRVLTTEFPKVKLAGAERTVGVSVPDEVPELGFDGRGLSSPGLRVGVSYYDYQANGRMNRQVDWRGGQLVHMTWMRAKNTDLDGLQRGMMYNFWDTYGSPPGFGFVDGIEVHPIGTSSEGKYSGYGGLDVDTEEKVNISAHFNGGLHYNTTIWYDFCAGCAGFSAYRSIIPDSTQEWIADPENQDDFEYIWPNHEYQVWDGDTVTHVFAQQWHDGIQPQIIAYFRRVGSDTLGAWDHPPIVIDTVMDIAQTVTASRVSGRVAMVWIAGLPAVPGGGESVDRGSQVVNDVYYLMSEDMGSSWSTTLDKINITKSDSSQAGWRAHTDISALIGTDDKLHIIWDAREYSPTPPPNGSFPHANGCRLFHWDETHPNEIRVIKDANWDLPPTGSCSGGAWNSMSIVKMQISECQGKFYAMFVQFQDVAHGITDDCHISAFTENSFSGPANGELYIAVSDNGGYNWDIARNLTKTYTPRCDTLTPGNDCGAEQWPSISRFGMQVVDYTPFEDAILVDPSNGAYTGNHYLDILYVDDKWPGGCVQDQGVWTLNELKWFRIPCVNPVPNPFIVTSPPEIGDPAWTKPTEYLDTTFRMENIGNAMGYITSVTAHNEDGSPAEWMSIGSWETEISHLSPNYQDVSLRLNDDQNLTGPDRYDGYIWIQYTDQPPRSEHFLPIHLIVADTVQFPEQADIRTMCTRLIINNAGNMGDDGHVPDGGFNMNFFNDCDTTNNRSGTDANAAIYLYDASPFVARVNELYDTVLYSYIFDADWLSYDGMRPQIGIVVDSTSFSDYQFASTGNFVTKDSAMGLQVDYYAPKHPDTCKFIVIRQYFYNNTDDSLKGVYIGDLFDWDIPSDTGVENGSDFDHGTGPGSRDLMYCFGGEYSAPGDTTNNHCVDADNRCGGMAYYNGVKLPYFSSADSFENPLGPWWTHTNADWVRPAGGFVPKQLYEKMENMGSAWEVWESSNPSLEDSLYQDLHMISVMGKFDFGPGDTLLFCKILATEDDGGYTDLYATVDQARAWIGGRPDIWTWPTPVIGRCCFGSEVEPDCEEIIMTECEDKVDYISWDYGLNCTDHPCLVPCECIPGDADGSTIFNMLDILHLIAYLYKGGPTPTPYTICSGDADGSCTLNMLDILHLIAYLYKGGPPPVDCETWRSTCGSYE